MQRDTPDGSEILNAEAIEILRRACQKKSSLRAALRDPRAFLAKNGIELAANVELRLYELRDLPEGSGKHGLPEVAEPMLGDVLDKYVSQLHVSPGLESYWEDTHEGCPFGTYPYKMKKKVMVCDVWGVFAGSREWVQDVANSSLGHWDFPNAQSVCLLSHEMEVEVTECLPRYSLFPV